MISNSYPLHQLAQQVQGIIIGNPEFEITGVATPLDAQTTDIVFLLDQRWLEAIKHSAAQAVLVPEQVTSETLPDKYLIQVPQIRPALATILKLFEPPELAFDQMISPSAEIADDVEIAPQVYIGQNTKISSGCRLYPFSYIGDNCELGEGCIIYSHVTLKSNISLGKNVIIHSGSVLGSDGYGYYQAKGKHYKIPQIGGVVVGDDVEIGANVTIDRGTVGVTSIGRGTKIDNQVHIAHNVQIGEDCLLIAQVGISGSTVIGDRVTLAGQVGIAGHLNIGHDVVAAGKSGITKDIPPGTKISGFPAQEHLKELRFQAALRKIPEFLKWWQKQK